MIRRGEMPINPPDEWWGDDEECDEAPQDDEGGINDGPDDWDVQDWQDNQ